jgi:hypothetical protein
MCSLVAGIVTTVDGVRLKKELCLAALLPPIWQLPNARKQELRRAEVSIVFWFTGVSLLTPVVISCYVCNEDFTPHELAG